jgi:hypothetical protein
MALSDASLDASASDATLLDLSGRGTTGPGGYDLTISAQLTTTGPTGYVRLVGGASGPVVQVVPPGNDPCGCWCLNVKRTDTLPSDLDARLNVYVRDTGDGITTFDQFTLISSIGGDCNTFSTAEIFFLTFSQGDFQGKVADSDGDGVPDNLDQCPATTRGSAVNEHGCSIDQVVPCAGPVSGGTWRHHGQYVLAVARAAAAFHSGGLITATEKRAVIRAALRSDCGRRYHSWR